MCILLNIIDLLPSEMNVWRAIDWFVCYNKYNFKLLFSLTLIGLEAN